MNVLTRAAAEMQKRGKTNWLIDDHGVCLVGAVGVAKGYFSNNKEMWNHRTANVRLESYSNPYGSIVTKEEARVIGGIISEQYPEFYKEMTELDTCPGRIIYLFSDYHSEDEVVAVLEKAGVKLDERI